MGRSFLPVLAILLVAAKAPEAPAQASPVPPPDLIATSTAPSIDRANQIFSLADALSYISTLVTVFGILLAVISVVFILVSFLGFREILQIREFEGRLTDSMKRSDDARANYESAKNLIDDLIRDFGHQANSLREDLSKESGKLIQAAYHFSTGETAYNKGDFEKAIIEYELAVKIRPSDVNIYARMGRALVNIDRTDEACRTFEQALQIDPNNPQCHYGLATVWRYKDRTKALGHAQMAKSLSPKSPEILNYLGLLCRDDEEFEKAIANHLEALAVQSSSITHFYLALLYGRVGKDTHARAQILSSLVDLEQERTMGAIRPIWEWVVRWGAAVIDEDEKLARDAWAQVVGFTTSDRVMHAVSDHAQFLSKTKSLKPSSYGGAYETSDRVRGDAEERQDHRS